MEMPPNEIVYKYFVPTGEYEMPDGVYFIGWFRTDPDREAEALSKELLSLNYWPIIRKTPEGLYEVFVKRGTETGRSNYWVNVVLFLLTILTTLAVGAFHAGKNPLTDLANLVYGGILGGEWIEQLG